MESRAVREYDRGIGCEEALCGAFLNQKLGGSPPIITIHQAVNNDVWDVYDKQ